LPWQNFNFLVKIKIMNIYFKVGRKRASGWIEPLQSGQWVSPSQITAALEQCLPYKIQRCGSYRVSWELLYGKQLRAEVVEHLPSKCKALSSNPGTAKTNKQIYPRYSWIKWN
jgi:hypothetical protein